MIICVTLNPSLDTRIVVNRLKGRDAKAQSVSYRIAGKAMNTAEALAASGEDCRSIVFLGQAGGFASLEAPHEAIEHTRPIRQNFTIYEGDELIAHVRSPFKSNLIELCPMLNLVGERGGPGDLLVLAGSLPDLSEQDREGLIKELADLPQRLVIDSSSLTLEELEIICPDTIKLNSSEFCNLIGISSDRELLITDLQHVHKITNSALIVTQGADDVLSISHDSVFYTYSIAPQFVSPLQSVVGSGDAFLAGYVSGLLAGATFPEAVRRGMIFGIARQQTSVLEQGEFSSDVLSRFESAPVLRQQIK